MSVSRDAGRCAVLRVVVNDIDLGVHAVERPIQAVKALHKVMPDVVTYYDYRQLHCSMPVSARHRAVPGYTNVRHTRHIIAM